MTREGVGVFLACGQEEGPIAAVQGAEEVALGGVVIAAGARGGHIHFGRIFLLIHFIESGTYPS
jgi:hypothetical protein